MEILGTVVEIVNGKMVLIETIRPIYPETILTVFASVTHNQLKEKHGLDHLYVPKGQLRVTSKQNDKYCLAEVFRPKIESGRIVEKPTSLLSGILTQEVVKEVVEGPPSAYLGTSTLKVDLETMRVVVGDSVGTD